MEEKNFSDLDANFKSQMIANVRLNFHDGFTAPAVLEGFPWLSPDGKRSRLPLDVAGECEQAGVLPMSMQGAGEILRFRTDSDVIGIRARFSEVYVGDQRGGSTGFDLYSGRGYECRFHGNRVIPARTDCMDALYSGLPSGKFTEYSLYFPYHCATSAIEIGLRPGSRLMEPEPHRITKPVVFYGSSITNCGAAGRPGLVYPAIIARYHDFPLINMGFSGSCRGELCIAETIGKLDLAALVIEFDHNAPDAAFLATRHEPFFKCFRALKPDVPVLMLSKADFNRESDAPERREIIMRTWLNALQNHDGKVDFLDGETLWAGPFRTECTQDGCHPNDFGAMLMAERIGERLMKLIL